MGSRRIPLLSREVLERRRTCRWGFRACEGISRPTTRVWRITGSNGSNSGEIGLATGLLGHWVDDARQEIAMNAARSVLCPIDFSESSRGALRYAAAVASQLGARLTLLAVNDPLLI